MPFRASAPFLPSLDFEDTKKFIAVSMPSRADASFLQKKWTETTMAAVSMPSRAKAPFLLVRRELTMENYKEYQCPFGLKLHFYGTPSKT